SDVVPFGVEGNKVYMDGSIIRDASIGSAQIGHAAITNAHIGNASINGAQIQHAAIGSAHIVNGSIDNAKIGQVIQSYNWDGYNGWMIDKNGNVYFGNGTFRGDIYANNGHFKGTVEATRFVGDIANSNIYADLGAVHSGFRPGQGQDHNIP
ncbi:hypothetical protein GTU75_08285, partial [Erysipelothrix rhusiopathiae]|nr:hypothetical protein [Erysipelothrix rhusiopathiae]